MSQEKDKVAVEYTIEQKAKEEGWKLDYDLQKHLTTLNTGSILILAAFMEKIFTNPQWKALVAISIALFVISTIAAIVTMTSIFVHIRDLGNVTKFNEWMYSNMPVVSFATFLGGIFSLAVFSVKNLYQ
ncbi:MAG: hypothetical protein M3268_02140 [Acidobacteriota bacterium]|nr:hypothetical protein [Acidobacteriota bacterium]